MMFHGLTLEQIDIFSKFFFPLVGECLVKVPEHVKIALVTTKTFKTQGNI